MPDIKESDVIADVIVVEPNAHGDQRGRFVETYRRSWFPLGREMTQANRSEKQAGAIVGLHYHLHQADYWYVLRGTARVVLHDLRRGSPTDGATLTLDLDGDHDRGLFIPPGVAHGFASLTDITLWYLVDNYYNPNDELGVAWDDPAIGADWGLSDPVLSERDRSNPLRSRDRSRRAAQGRTQDLIRRLRPPARSDRRSARLGEHAPRSGFLFGLNSPDVGDPGRGGRGRGRGGGRGRPAAAQRQRPELGEEVPLGAGDHRATLRSHRPSAGQGGRGRRTRGRRRRCGDHRRPE